MKKIAALILASVFAVSAMAATPVTQDTTKKVVVKHHKRHKHVKKMKMKMKDSTSKM